MEVTELTLELRTLNLKNPLKVVLRMPQSVFTPAIKPLTIRRKSLIQRIRKIFLGLAPTPAPVAKDRNLCRALFGGFQVSSVWVGGSGAQTSRLGASSLGLYRIYIGIMGKNGNYYLGFRV